MMELHSVAVLLKSTMLITGSLIKVAVSYFQKKKITNQIAQCVIKVWVREALYVLLTRKTTSS